MAAAAARGAQAVGGQGMLVHQAARAFSSWTGHPAPVEAMLAAVDPPPGA
jgi:shikimate 5-dehydrogenase